jgi:predicted permease
MERLLKDLRHALRQLRKAPGFALTVVLTLALGIGATTAIFTLLYDVMLRPLPYRDADRLVVMEEVVAEFRDIYPRLPVNANHFVNWERNSRTLKSMAVLQQRSMPLGAGGHPQQVEVVAATPGLFAVLDAGPELGRAFSAEEGQSGHDRVVVLMNSLWRTRFESDPAILGKTISLNGYPYTVVGVMPQAFHLPLPAGLAGADTDQSLPVGALIPLAFSGDELAEAMGDFDYLGLARLKDGVGVDQASAEINALEHRISKALPADQKGTLSAVLTPFQETLVGHHRTPILILLAAVAGLLLVGCVNIANLLLSRAVARRQQMAVAAALGARRIEMLGMAMRETVVLAAAGGLLGLGLAAALVPLLQHYLPPALDFRGPLHLDWVGAGCALLLAVGAALVAGAVPAWMISRTEPGAVLHSESRLASESRASKRLRHILVGLEVAVSVVLVLTTGLVATSLVELTRIDRGFETEHILTAEINLPASSYSSGQAREAFYRRVLERLDGFPGLEHAGFVSHLPLSGDRWIDMIRVPGDSRPIMQLPPEHFRWISPGYLEAIHLALVRGRSLTAADEGKPLALVSERTAHTFWPGKDPVGQQFTRGGLNGQAPFTVIGVVKDARTISLAEPDPMMVYVPYWYRSDSSGGLAVRTRMEPAQIADALRRTIWSVDPEVSVPVVRLMGGVVADSVSNRRFEMDLLLVFAVSALVLAGLGVYGVVSCSVVQRQREIGLRLALGAQSGNIYGLILREGLGPVLAGALAGISIGFGTERMFHSLLFGVSPYNPLIAGGAVVVLLAVGSAACLVPARQAAGVDPIKTLRAE